ncbi:MAG: D-glycero-beta-D-manno-heptose 1-phosphate adenylyltransferase [Arenicellales bacterium]
MAATDKIVHDRSTLRSAIEALKKPVVFTNGCFDILHRGHVTYLAQAAELGGSLVVGVNSDDSVKRLDKSSDRPFNSLEDRMAVLAALESVDLVVPFDEDTPAELIELVRPDHLVKGGDWAEKDIVGAEAVKSRGGQVHSIPFKYDRSTTDLIRRIRSGP